MENMLDGVSVVSLEHMEAAPAASVWLADWGAEVIKVESLQGERWRGGSEVADNWAFQLLNRNKKSLSLNLATNQGREILYNLIKKSDVFISNYQLDTLNKLKVDYDSLNEVNHTIIYALLTGYGTKGPEKDERAYDFTAAWARAGFQYIMGEPNSPPVRQRGGMMDRTAASHLVAGICAALLYKERTGQGQLVEVSLYHSAVWTLALDIELCLMGRPAVKRSRTNPVTPMINSYRAKDNRWFQIAMPSNNDTWSDIFLIIEKPELVTDPRFNSNKTRRENTEELVRILDEVFESKTSDEWERIFKEYKFIFSIIKSPDEVITDPQAIANGFFSEIDHQEGKIKLINTPVGFVQNPAFVKNPAPEIGQNNDDILLNLGYSVGDIAVKREQGIIT
ncbi:MAG: CoA transferase [Dehalococcoidales bacterium]|nr:MAG: CoA transferase [Dehalococcoidales bacterium]